LTAQTRLQGGPEGRSELRRVNLPLVVVVVICLLPYVNLGPFSAPSQVQPWAAVLAWLWVAFRAIRSGLRISAVQWALLLFALYFSVRVYGGEGFDLLVYLRRSATFLLSAGIFLAGQYLTPATLWRALKVTLPIWLVFGVLRYINATIYYALVSPLVPTVVVSNFRGSSSLAPEATDFGFTMVAMVVLCMITRRCLTQEGIHAEKWPLAAAIVSALLSLSGTGYIGLAVVGLIYVLTGPAGRFITIGRSLFAALVAICAVMIISLVPSGTIRGIDLLKTAIQDPIALMGTSFSYRVVHLVVGVLGLVDSGFWGYGAGSFVNEAPDIYYMHRLGSVFGLVGHYAVEVPVTLGQAPLAQFALISLEFGVIGILYLILVFGFAIRSRIPFKSVAVALVFLAWLQSFPAGWPPFWIIIGIMMSPHFVVRQTLDYDRLRPSVNKLRNP